MPQGKLRVLLETSVPARIAELVVVFGVPTILIVVSQPLVGDSRMGIQLVAWVANVVMLLLVWLSLRVRGDDRETIGLVRMDWARPALLRLIAKAALALLGAVAAFILGSIVAANIVGIPETADLSGYNYLQGNLPMLLFALAGVYIVSSFGEEVVYRGFLIRRLADIRGGVAHWPAATVVAAVIFGLAHFTWGVMGVVQTTFMGIALGAAYLKAGRTLWVTILAHACMDTVLLVQLYLSP